MNKDYKISIVMNKDYIISNDGTIFEIKEDGSISRIARIDDNGNISSISGTISGPQQGGKGKYWFFIILFLVSSAVLGVLYLQTSDSFSHYRWESYQRLSEVNEELSEVNEELSETKSIISNIAETYPLIITDIKIGNFYKGGDIQTDYGKRIYDYNTMYLRPKISYIGLISGTKELKVKWYTPSGYLSRGDSSPYGFSQSYDEYISKGNNTLTLSGWGNDDKGYWSSGTYRIEIWYENTCLKSKTFTIY